MRSTGSITALGLLALLAVGCQRQGDIVGKVIYKNKPLVFGTVLFQAADGTIRQGNIETDGSYAVRGVPTGEARAAVNSPNPKGITVVSRREEPVSYPDVPGWFAIPERYQTPAKSGLTYPVNGGENKIDIELK
jgi:hypothetical protein